MPRKVNRDVDENPLEKSIHADDVKESAMFCIRKFFTGRKMVNGGPIPEKELYCSDNIKRVLRTQFDDETFNYIHFSCLPMIPKSKKYHDPTLSWEVHCLLTLISKMRKHKVPKEFQPGMLLLYFKYCRGIEIPPVPML